MVRLKLEDTDLNLIYYFLSQFHYGSIKTADWDEIQYVPFPSQFHYGSIKTYYFIKKVSDNLYVSIPLWFD